MKNYTVEEVKITGWHWFVYGCLIVAVAIYFKPSPDKVIDEYIALPPCEPWDRGDYWCKSYVDWGYANGLVMAKRIRGDLTIQGKEWACDEVVDDLYEKGHKVSSDDFPFRTRR